MADKNNSKQLTIHDDEYWEIKELFLKEAEALKDQFAEQLAQNLSQRTVTKYIVVLNGFIDYLYHYTPHVNFEEVTIGNANSKFYAQYQYEHLDGVSKKETKTRLHKFFVFLKQQDIENPKVLKSLVVQRERKPLFRT